MVAHAKPRRRSPGRIADTLRRASRHDARALLAGDGTPCLDVLAARLRRKEAAAVVRRDYGAWLVWRRIADVFELERSALRAIALDGDMHSAARAHDEAEESLGAIADIVLGWRFAAGLPRPPWAPVLVPRPWTDDEDEYDDDLPF